MREFGLIYSGYWSWCYRKGLNDACRVLASYLFSCQHGNSLGCYQLPVEYIAADLGYSINKVTKALSELEKKGFVRHCQSSRYVFMPKFLKWNPPSSPNHAKGVMRCASEIPVEFTYWTEISESIANYLTIRIEIRDISTVLPSTLPQVLTQALTKALGQDLNEGHKQDHIETLPNTDTDTETDTDTDTHTEEGRGSGGDFIQEVVDVFAEILPENVPPRGIKLEPDLRKQIQSRCNELAERRDIDWWRGYFQDVRECPHLMGENSSGWQASISWLTGPKNMSKVLSGDYRRSARAKNAKPSDQGLAEKDYSEGLEEWNRGRVQ